MANDESTNRSSAQGGAAGHAGAGYENRVAAWFAVHVLAEAGSVPIANLPAVATYEQVLCQTTHAVDDVKVATSSGISLLCQAKRSLALGTRAASELASVLDQFVREYLACREGDRCDAVRLLLVTSSLSSGPIRDSLRRLLNRIRLSPRVRAEQIPANRGERAALRSVRDHVERSWRAQRSDIPSEEEFRRLLSMTHVLILDLEDDETNEREARGGLRALLEDPSQDGLAWSHVLEVCQRLASERGSADREMLQGSLEHQGVRLRAVRSFQQDIHRLTSWTDSTLQVLASHAKILAGNVEVQLQRQCVTELCRLAETGPLLVTGEPGAGKTGALCLFVQEMHELRRPSVVLAADRLGSTSLGQLRMELGLEHELVDVLDNWLGAEPACLVIDGLDAARGDGKSQMLRDLISLIGARKSRWTVVASMRRFDLARSELVQELFAGPPSAQFADPDFQRLRHVSIPPLSRAEIDILGKQVPTLRPLMCTGSPELAALLRNPYNVQLMARLNPVGAADVALQESHSQLDLLDLYWKRRILRDDGRRDDRETVLRTTCDTMVRSRQLRVDRAVVAALGASQATEDLLRDEILTEWAPSQGTSAGGYVLAFSQNLLFDYATARLLLRGTSGTLARRLQGDPDLILVAYPSFVFHFEHLLASDPWEFWREVLSLIRDARVEPIVRVVGPSAVARLASRMQDLEPLCSALDDATEVLRNAADECLGYVISAVSAREAGGFTKKTATPWCELVERVSRTLRPRIAYAVDALLTDLTKPGIYAGLSSAQRRSLGQAARGLLDFAWAGTQQDRYLVVRSLQAACRTYATARRESAALLSRALAPEHLADHGYEELPWLAREVEGLLVVAPGFVEQLYRVAFSYRDRSREATPLGTSRILPMTSERSQDYGLALYGLADAFPVFLKVAPERATRAMLEALNWYVEHEHRVPRHATGKRFDLDGRTATIRGDLSYIWDRDGVYEHEEPIRLLTAFEEHLGVLAESKDREVLAQVVSVVVERNVWAVVWRRLLRAGAAHPDILGELLRPLAWSVPVLASPDTDEAMESFLRALGPRLSVQERGRAEAAITSLSQHVPQSRRVWADELCTRYLHALTGLRSSLAAPSEEPEQMPQPGTGVLHKVPEETPTEGMTSPSAQDTAVARAREFAGRFTNTAPTREDVVAILPSLRELDRALKAAELVHDEESPFLGYLASACANIARQERLTSEVATFIRRILLEAAAHPDPEPNPGYDAQFDRHPSWGGFAPRIEASEGLMFLSRHREWASPEVFAAIERLSVDPVPAVRYHVSRYLNAMFETAPQLLWQLIERFASSEASMGVLQGLLHGPLARLVLIEPDRVIRACETVFDRASTGSGAQEVRSTCVRLFLSLYINRDHANARNRVFGLVRDLRSNAEDAIPLVFPLADALTFGPVAPPNAEDDAIRARAFRVLTVLVQRANEALRVIDGEYGGRPVDSWPEDAQNQVRSLFKLIDDIGHVVKRAAHPGEDQQHAPLDQATLRRLMSEAGPILDELVRVGHAAIAYALVETLERFVPVDPRGTLVKIACLIAAGKGGGLQLEHMAADRVVTLVQRYLADYRDLIIQDAESRAALRTILNVFVGRPNAQKIAFRLYELFR